MKSWTQLVGYKSYPVQDAAAAAGAGVPAAEPLAAGGHAVPAAGVGARAALRAWAGARARDGAAPAAHHAPGDLRGGGQEVSPFGSKCF